MKDVPCNPLLEVTPEDMSNVQKFFDTNPTKIKESLDTVEEWCKKQEHLVEAYKYIDRRVIERLYILAKGSTEMTKLRIEKIFTSRGMLPDLLLNRSYAEFDKCWHRLIYVPLPKLDPINQYRYIVAKIIDENFEGVSMLTFLRFIIMILEFRLFYDYMHGDIYIWDIGNMSIKTVTHFSPLLMRKIEILFTQAYNIRMKGIYFVNAPVIFDKLVATAKMFFKPKLVNRFHILNSFEDLPKEIPKEILPVDFGGKGPSLIDISNQWKAFLKTDEATKIINNLNMVKSDESKRSSYKFNEEYLGMPGSFGHMTVD